MRDALETERHTVMLRRRSTHVHRIHHHSMASSSSRGSSYDAFSSVDKLVSKPVVGSDGAASWQDFRKESSKLTRPSVAPAIPMKKADRLGTGMKSLQEERDHENRVRQEAGEAQVGAGYTHFNRNNEAEAAAERKKRKRIENRIRPDEKDYFRHSPSFTGWRFDYVFTTRDGKTGYWWDGMDSVKKMNGTLKVPEPDDEETKDEEESMLAMSDKPKKKKRKQKKDSSVEVPLIKDDPTNPVEMALNAMRRRNEVMMAPPKALTGGLLPAGWDKAIDPASGKVYYFNRTTGERSWEIPSSGATAVAQPTPDDDSSLPTGWSEAKDAGTGKVYYYTAGGETSWERPSA